MKSFGRLVIGAGAAVALAGCMHRGVENVSAGDITIDSLSASRTAILRVDNPSSSIVRVYMDMPQMKPNYVAKAMPGQARSWVLDPNMFPAQSVSFKVEPENGVAFTVGPYTVHKGEVVDIVVATDAGRARGSVHKSTP